MKSICNRKIMAVWITATTMSAHNWYKKWVGASWAAITLILPQIVGWSCAKSVCESPLLLYVCVCTSGAQGLLSIGSVWLNVKNCGFLPGASLSGSLPCLHFLNTPLFLNLLQVFGQDAKNTHRTWGAGLSPLQPLSSRPGFFFFFSPLKSRDFCLLWDNLMWCVFCLDTWLLFNLRLFFF